MVAAWRSGGVPHGREALRWFFMQWLLVENYPLVVHVEISLFVWDCPAVESEWHAHGDGRSGRRE